MRSVALKTVRREGDQTPVLAVRGELDVSTVHEFDRRLTELVATKPRGLIVDLGGSAFIDASACRVLLRAACRLGGHGGRLVVVNRDLEIARIFDVMGLDEFLTVAPSREAAQDVPEE